MYDPVARHCSKGAGSAESGDREELDRGRGNFPNGIFCDCLIERPPPPNPRREQAKEKKGRVRPRPRPPLAAKL